MNIKLLLGLLFFPTSLCAQVYNVQVQNPSFESAVSPLGATDCGPYYTGPESVPNWIGGDWNSSSGIGILQPICISAPDGKQILALQNATASQDLGDVYTILPHDANGEVNGIYTAHVFAANRFYWYSGKFSVSLLLECLHANQFCIQGTSQELCSISGWGMGDFMEVTFSCFSQREYGELFIVLASGAGTGLPSGNGYPNLFDKVSLTFTPTN